MNDELIKKIALDFYNHYHSFPSLDANEEFDKWWTGNEHKYSQLGQINIAHKNNIACVGYLNRKSNTLEFYSYTSLSWMEQLPTFNGVINNE